MIKDRMNSGVVAALVAALLAPPGLGATIPMGVARVGSSPGIRAVQGRLERWLQAEDSRVRRVREGVSEGALRTQRLRARWIRLLDRFEAVAEGTDVDPVGLTRILSEGKAMPPLPHGEGWGTLLQRWYVAQALGAAVAGRASGLVQQARAFHPEGKLVRALPAADWFERWGARRVEPGVTPPRQCHWSVTPAEKVWVNGFPVPNTEISLPAGKHVLMVRDQGRWFQREIRCRRAGRHHWNAAQSIPLGNRHPEVLAARYGVEHLWMVQKDAGGEVSLLVFTPGFGAEPIPLEKPLGTDSVLSPFDGEFAVDWAKARNLIQSHRVRYLASLEPMGGNSAATLDEPTRWYNDWKFWAVTAAVVGGVLTAVSVTRKDSVKTQAAPAVGIRF